HDDLLGGDAREAARLWALLPGKTPTLLTSMPDVKRAQLAPDGRRLLTQGAGGVRVYSAADGSPLTPFFADGAVEAEAFSPDGQRVLTRTPGRAQLWDAATGRLTASWGHQGEPLRRAEFSPGGRHVLTVCEFNWQLWSAGNGEARTQLMAHKGTGHPADF